MGNRSSTVSTEAEGEGVFSLSDKLQAKIAQEYQNEQIVKIFGKQIEKIGEKKAERLHQTLEARANLQRSMQSFRQKNASVQEKLDEEIDSKDAAFADLFNAASHDANRLEKKYSQSAKRGGVACLEERTAVAMACSAGKPIDLPVAAFESCVNRAISEVQ